MIQSGQTLQYTARKKKTSAVGISGVMAYNMDGKTLAIMFKVPNVFQGFGRKNRWNADLTVGIHPVNKKKYNAMLKRSFKGNHNWASRPNFSNDYIIRGAMSTSKHATLRIEVHARK